jgi:hypothetical protein
MIITANSTQFMMQRLMTSRLNLIISKQLLYLSTALISYFKSMRKLPQLSVNSNPISVLFYLELMINGTGLKYRFINQVNTL